MGICIHWRNKIDKNQPLWIFNSCDINKGSDNVDKRLYQLSFHWKLNLATYFDDCERFVSRNVIHVLHLNAHFKLCLCREESLFTEGCAIRRRNFDLWDNCSINKSNALEGFCSENVILIYDANRQIND